MAADFRGYAEIVFENPEDTVQSWHVDGHHFYVVGLFSFYNTMLTGTATTTFSANSLRPLRLPNSHQQTLLPKVVDFGNFGMLSAAQPRDSTPRDRMCRRRNLPLESSRCCRRRMSSCGADQILGMRCLQEAILETHQN